MTGWRLGVGVAVGAALTLIGAAASAPGQRPAADDPASGAYLYRTFCTRCHGVSGTGAGVSSDLLRTPPGDLTRLAARAGGEFPRDRVRRAIAGTPALPGHREREMPAFAAIFRVTEGEHPRIIERRVDALVGYLESLQRR